MTASVPNLRLLDRPTMAEELDLASQLFHRINRIISENQELLIVPPTCRVRDAIDLMRKHGYSRCPSFRTQRVSFAMAMAIQRT